MFGDINGCLNAIKNNNVLYRSFTYFNSDHLDNAEECYGTKDYNWGPIFETFVTSGRYENRNIYSIQLNKTNVNKILNNKINSLRLILNNNDNNDIIRSQKARYPKQYDEISMQYFQESGFIMAEVKFLEQLNFSNTTTVKLDARDFPNSTVKNQSCLHMKLKRYFWK